MSTPSPTKSTHYLVVTYPSWAHVRSEIGLSASLLVLNPTLHITILIPAKRSQAAALELAQYPPLDDPRRLVILHYGEDPQKVKGGMWNPKGGFRTECEEHLKPFTEPLARLETIVDPVTGKPVTPLQIPYSAIITDLTLGTFANNVKTTVALLQPDVSPPPVIGFAPYNTAAMAFFFVEDSEWYSPRVSTIMKEARDDEVKKMAMVDELIARSEDVIHVPGLWPFYMYESNPVAKESIATNFTMTSMLIQVLPTWFDEIVVGWPMALGKDLQLPVAKRFGGLYQVGFQLPPLVQDEWAVEPSDGECGAYLGQSGPKTVLYISFGSAIYAPTESQMAILLDVLEELGTRFIMAEGNAPDEIRTMMRERIGKGRSKGLLVTWAPQRAILSHPSTGMFLTHGGSNSAMEGILFRVPMVQWPAGFDQPYIANELDHLGVAKELIQIRGGPNMGRPLARDGRLVKGTPETIRGEMMGLFKDLDGELAQKMRANLDEISAVLRKDRDSGGSYQSVLKLSRLSL